MRIFDEIFEKVKDCQKCELCKTRQNIVIFDGIETAPVLIIGEAPGREEDEQGRPFVGKSGKLLDRLMQEANFSRTSNVYIANIVKCRPPDNRAPKKSEIASCRGYLDLQIDLLKPKLIVCVGRIAAQTLISPQLKVMQEHGKVFSYRGIPIAATLHPAAILRNPKNITIAQQDWKSFEILHSEATAQKAKFS